MKAIQKTSDNWDEVGRFFPFKTKKETKNMFSRISDSKKKRKEGYQAPSF